MYWSMLRSAVCRSGEVRVAGSPVAAPCWARARRLARSAWIGPGAGCMVARIGCWADQKSLTMVWICSGVPDPSSAFSNTRAAAVLESTHAEHTAEILSALMRSELVGAGATDGGVEVGAVADPCAPPQAVAVAVAVASTTSSVPRWRRMRPRSCWKATDSPHRRQRLDHNQSSVFGPRRVVTRSRTGLDGHAFTAPEKSWARSARCARATARVGTSRRWHPVAFSASCPHLPRRAVRGATAERVNPAWTL